MPSIPYPHWDYSSALDNSGDNNFYRILTSTNYTGPMGPPADETKIVELQNRIAELEKKLNDFIDNPEKVRGIRKVDPYGEENWDDKDN
jgi:hypothetical protein